MLPLILAAASLLSASAPSDAGQVADIPMDFRWQKPAIEVKLNGTGPYWFLLDSGVGPYLIVDSDLAAELKLPVEEKAGAASQGHAHRPAMDTVYVDAVEVGSFRYEGVQALSWNPGMYADPVRPRGIVGVGLFGGTLVTFDYPAGRVRLQRGDLPEPDGAGVLDAPSMHNIPSIEIDVAGRRVMARLATGSTGFLTLPPDMASQLPLASAPVEAGRAQTSNGPVVIRTAALNGSVSFGGLRIENPPLDFMEAGGATVGSDLLRSLIVTIDRKNQRVRLVSDGRPLVASTRSRLGLLHSGVQDGKIPIERVRPGSPAEEAGLHAGDAIVKIGGRPVAAMRPGDVAFALRSDPLRLSILRDGHEVEVDVRVEPAGQHQPLGQRRMVSSLLSQPPGRTTRMVTGVPAGQIVSTSLATSFVLRLKTVFGAGRKPEPASNWAIAPLVKPLP